MGSCRRTTNSQPLSILLSASLPSRSALVLTVIRKSFGFRIEFWRSTRQSHGGRRDFLRTLDDPQLVFDWTAWDRLKYQFDCPFHLQRLPQPTTLHTLVDGLQRRGSQRGLQREAKATRKHHQDRQRTSETHRRRSRLEL